MQHQKLSLVRKGLLLIALPAVSQLMLLGFLFYLQHSSSLAEQWAVHSREVLSTSEEAFRRLAQAQSDARGYVVTSEPVFEQAADSALNDALRTLEKLHRLVADNPPQQRRVEAVQVAAADYAAWSINVRNLVRSGDHEKAVGKVRDLSGRTRLNVVESGLQEFRTEEERLSQIRVNRLVRTRTLQQLVLLIATVATFAIAALIVLVFSRGVSRRLAVLTENARRLANGDPLAAPVSGNDEITALDGVLHNSATKLAAAAEVERCFKEEVEARAAELARVNEELLQKTQENEMFVYSVSHDLRSPLVNLQGFGKELAQSCAELRAAVAGANLPQPLQGHLLGMIERDLPDSLRFIQSAVTRSANIIDAMLRLSRAGRVEYRWQSIPIRQVVDRIIDSAAGTVAERKATITVGDLPDAWGDLTAVEQIFGNLIVNALNYLDPARLGEIEVGALSPSPAADSQPITYYVKDNGLGIPQAYLHKIFVAFQRLHGDSVKGEGIGLALVRRMVERHGGRIWVESRENVGSTFFVALPATEDGLRVAAEAA